MFAAGASPGPREHWLAVGAIANATLTNGTVGGSNTTAAEFAGLIRSAEREHRSIGVMQDFTPPDPRDRIVVRLSNHLVRLFPGSVERPVADVERALLVAAAIDDLIAQRMGFGIEDYMTVVLRYVDWALVVLSPTWPEVKDEESSALTQHEVDAARQVMLGGTPEHLVHDDRAQRALKWATSSLDSLPHDPGDPQSQFHEFVRVESNTCAEARWLPLAFLPEALTLGVTKLASYLADSAEANEKWAQVSAARVRRALWKFCTKILGPQDIDNLPTVSPENVVQWISIANDDTAIAVQITSLLEIVPFPSGVPWAAAEAAHQPTGETSGQGSPIRMPGATVTLDRSVHVVPLMVVATPSHIAVPQIDRMASMSLDDLTWISSTADSETDLFEFCRDLSRPDAPRYMGWETINVWEWWKSNGKTIFSGGSIPTFMTIEPHMGSAEWARAQRLSGAEEALFELGLPPLRDFDGVDHSESGPPTPFRFTSIRGNEIPVANSRGEPDQVGDGETVEQWNGVHPFPGMEGWTLYTGHPSVAIEAVGSMGPADEFEFMNRLRGAFAFGFGQVAEAWADVHVGTGIRGYVVELTSTSRVGADVLSVVDVAGDATKPGVQRVRLAVRALHDRFDDHPSTDSLKIAMAEVVRVVLGRCGIRGSGVDRVYRDWCEATPTLTIRALAVPTINNRLPDPVELDRAFLSEMDRTVAIAVKDKGIEPGKYELGDAQQLDRDTLAPIALDVLTRRLVRHDADDLIRFGMEQLERVLSRRDRQLRDVLESARYLTLDWNPRHRYTELQNEHLLLRRSIESVLEAAMRSAASGVEPVGERAWAESIAAGYSYLAATDRSERVHYQVTPTRISVSEMFEIQAEAASSSPSGQVSFDVDLTEFARAKSAENFGDDAADGHDAELDLNPDHSGVRSAMSSSRETEDEEPAPTSPVDAGIDEAMLTTSGVSGMDIFTILFALASWPPSGSEGNIISASKTEVVQHIVDNTVLGEDSTSGPRVEAGVDSLTSTWADMQNEDWKPWQTKSRRRRVSVRPLVSLRDGTLIVAPHYCFASLSIYQRYLSQGQLPWSQPEPPQLLKAALERFRDSKNRELEDTVASVLRSNGWTVIERIKVGGHRRLGIPVVSTEIDIVAGRSDSNRIFVLEVKDPADVYSPSEMARQLKEFFEDRGRKLCYATQLGRKYDELRPYPDELASALGISARTRTVEALFVTRHPICAAFVGSSFAFVTLKDVVATLGDSRA